MFENLYADTDSVHSELKKMNTERFSKYGMAMLFVHDNVAIATGIKDDILENLLLSVLYNPDFIAEVIDNLKE